jgi:antitoxin FitA
VATLTIRNLPVDLVARIKERAGRGGRSMEQEVRDLLIHQYGTREAILERMRRRADALPPAALEDIDRWIAADRDDATWTR